MQRVILPVLAAFLFSMVGVKARGQDCGPIIAGGSIQQIGSTDLLVFYVPPVLARIERAEVEITLSALSTKLAVDYDLFATVANTNGTFGLAEKIGGTSITTNFGGRTLVLPLSSNFVARMQNELVGDPTNTTTLTLAGVLESVPGANTALNKSLTRLNLWIQPTNPPKFLYVTASQAAYTPGQGAVLQAQAVPCARFQWRKDGADIPGATRSYFYIASLAEKDQGTYSVVAANSAGASTSSVMQVSFQEMAPVISPSTPVTLTRYEGDSADFCFNIAAWPVGSVRWEHNGVTLMNFTNQCLAWSDLRLEDGGDYRLTVTNPFGTSTNTLTLEVIRAAPVIADILDLTVIEGGSVKFPISVTGGPVPLVTLFLNETNVALPDFTIGSARTNQSGEYYFVASNALGVATSRRAKLTVLPAGPLDRWTERNPLPQVNTIHSLAAGNGMLMAVGDAGTVLTSTSGKQWSLQDRPLELNLNAVHFSEGQFIVGGDVGSTLLTAAGVEWKYSPILANAGIRVDDIAYGKGRYVAVTTGGVYSSPDGLRWERVLENLFGLQSVTFGNGVFSAGGNALAISSDGINWTHLHPTEEIERIRFVGGQFMAVGDDGTLLTSQNAQEWEQQDSGTDRRIYSIAYGNGRYVAVGARGTILSSADARAWRPEVSGTPDRLETVLFYEGLFVAAGENGTMLSSPDGITWTKENTGIVRDLDGVVTAADRVVAVGKGGVILTSVNGVDFSERSSGITNDIHGLGWNSNLFVAVGENGAILSSTDAITWTSRASGVTNSLKRVIFAKDLWVTVGTEGAIVVSADGTNWTALPRVTLEDLNDITYGNGKFVIVGDTFLFRNGTILTSTNGIAWTGTTIFTGKNLRSVHFANGTFLAAGNDGLIASSTNAINWEVRFIGARNLRDVQWHNGTWWLVGNEGTIVTSQDAISWTHRATRARENLHEVAVLQGKSIVIGNRGTILQSGYWTASSLTVSLANGTIRLNVDANGAGALEVSNDLRNWSPLTNWIGSGFEYLEQTDREPIRFFRGLEAIQN